MEFWHPGRHPSQQQQASRYGLTVASLVGFQNSRFEQTGLKISTHVTGESPVTWGVTLSPTWFEWRKVLIRRDWNPLIKNAEKKVLFGSNVVFQKGAKWSKYRFFMLLLLRILVGNIFYMLSDSNLLKNILIRQISSHRCRCSSWRWQLRITRVEILTDCHAVEQLAGLGWECHWRDIYSSEWEWWYRWKLHQPIHIDVE